MSFPRYPEYKDSGVEWLGEVPAHWGVAKFRHCFQESPEKIENEVVGAMLSVSGYRGIEVKEYDDENRRRTEEELVGYRIVRPGQLVVNTMWLNYAGLGVSEHEGHVSPAYRSYWIKPELSRRYVHHLMRSETYVKGYTKFLTGIRPNSLQMSRDDLMVFPVLVPPVVEQVAVAQFLDSETGKIDRLISEQEKLIALLKEKRQAVISHAVTKGLDPNVPMKDSGIEWLGEVPAHWVVTKIKYLIQSLGQGWSPQCEGFPVETDDEWGVLKVGCVNGGVFSANENKRLPDDQEPVPELGLVAGDLLISRANTRELVGSAAVVDREYPRLMLCDKLYRVRVVHELTMPEFLSMYIGSDRVRGQIELAATGASSSMLNIAQSTILELVVAIPRIDEQRGIMQSVGLAINALEAMTREARLGIDLLRERRSALISAAVTGKIDVRQA